MKNILIVGGVSLVLFSVSPAYLGLRKDLGIALPEQAAMPLLDVA